MGAERLIRLLFDRRPGGAEVLMFRQHDTEHLNGLGVFRHGKPNALTRGGIEIREETVFIDFAAHHGPRLLLKRVLGIPRNGGGTGKAVQELRKPLRPGVRVVPFGLREIQRQVMRHDAVLDLHLPK